MARFHLHNFDDRGDRAGFGINSLNRVSKSRLQPGDMGERLIMSELLRLGFDAQLADENAKGYDLLAGRPNAQLRKVQIRAVRVPPWYVSLESFEGDFGDHVTVYLLIGPGVELKASRYFVAKNRDLAAYLYRPSGWDTNAILRRKALEDYENNWYALLE